MKPAAVVAAGVTFVGCVVLGFVAGVYAARVSGQAGWAIVGIFAGLLVGVAAVARQLRSALR